MRYLPLVLSLMVWTSCAMEEKDPIQEAIDGINASLRINRMILKDEAASKEEREKAIHAIVTLKGHPLYAEAAKFSARSINQAPIPKLLHRATKIDKDMRDSFLRSSSSSVPKTPKSDRKKK